MILYDIHTHRTGINASGDYIEKSIMNTSPAEYVGLDKNDKGRWVSCGIHPWDSSNSDIEINLLENIIKEDNVLAIGEVGLDKLKGPDMEIQYQTFRSQIELAIQVDKPLIIHCVKAWEELIALHKEYKTDIPWIIHGYRGNVEQTKQLSRLGFKFSIGEKYNKEALHLIPQNSIFCETDMSELSICQIYEYLCPYIAHSFEQFVGLIAENVLKTFNFLTKL
ncbi:MAG: TatD family hydrolase [Dysgonomonas sp.]|nr:TatD family hydrolase [Dysgonomonas sp.]